MKGLTHRFNYVSWTVKRIDKVDEDSQAPRDLDYYYKSTDTETKIVSTSRRVQETKEDSDLSLDALLKELEAL
jgi:hypothetical protein